MKNLMIFLLSLMALTSACSSNKGPDPSTNVTFLIDNTEKCGSRDTLIPTQSVVDLIGYNGKVTFRQVNQVSLNTESSVSLKMPAGKTRLKIKKVNKPFLKKLNALRMTYLGPTEKAKKSSIWEPVCESIEDLKKSDVDNKVLVIVSDMIEFSSNGDFYHTSVEDIKKIKEKMRKNCGINELPKESDVSVKIIFYNPTGDTEYEERFKKSMKIWAVFFEEAGIDYEVKANL